MMLSVIMSLIIDETWLYLWFGGNCELLQCLELQETYFYRYQLKLFAYIETVVSCKRRISDLPENYKKENVSNTDECPFF